MGVVKDLTGQRFGSLTALEKLPYSGRTRWLFRCDCGKTKSIKANSVLCGLTKSCGCKQFVGITSAWQKTVTHGASKRGPNHGTYRTWRCMIERCRYSYDTDYDQITVCDRWQKFENFLKDMGCRPPKMSIERIDRTKGYFPGNCRWATQVEQQNNKKNNRQVSFEGEMISLRLALRKLGVPQNRLSMYSKRACRLLDNGKDWKDALWDYL